MFSSYFLALSFSSASTHVSSSSFVTLLLCRCLCVEKRIAIGAEEARCCCCRVCRRLFLLCAHSLTSVRVTTEVFCYASKVVEMFFKYPYLAFICGSLPFEVDSVYVGFSHERARCQDCRLWLHLVIVCCGSVKALLLGFH